jgi:hypothetical protein
MAPAPRQTKATDTKRETFMRWLLFRLPPWLEWSLLIAAAILLGALCKAAFAPVSFWSWRTLLTALVASLGTIFLCWISAPEYNPLQAAAGLRTQIFTSAALAALTVLVWTAIKR